MIAKLDAIILDTPDIRGLAEFYSQLTGWSQHHGSDEWISLRAAPDFGVGFQLALDHVAPQWPDPKHPQQMHLDFLVPDREAAVERALELGATRLPGGGDTWTVVADPSGHPLCLCQGDNIDQVTLVDLSIDVPDGKAMARFYAELLGLDVTYEGEEGAAIGADGRLTIMFQNVAEYHAPHWPDPAFPQQFHLDLKVDDIDAAQKRVLALGATKLSDGGDTWTVFADPVGHPFCLCYS